MQQESFRFQLTPWVRRLIAANAIVYLLSITIFTGNWFIELFAFSPTGVDRPWGFLTYMFVHGSFLHLAFNMLMLFFFGPGVERKMGGTAFLRYYVLCGLGGPVLAFAIALFMPVMPFVGASAAVFGVALAFAWYWPDARVYLFPLPVPIPIKYLVAFLVMLDLLPLMLGVDDGIAHLAHLGGFLFGIIYLKGEALFERGLKQPAARAPEARVLVPHSTAAEEPENGPVRPLSRGESRRDRHKEVDRVLDKISASGMASLTPEERKLLDEMSRELRKD